MFQRESIDPTTLELLKYIQSLKVFSGLRLVGGTALALGKRKKNKLELKKLN